MAATRNPFKLRLAEQIEADETFLRLFSPAALTPFLDGLDWRKVQIIRSSPGGGKTSLLRILTPRHLSTLWRARGNDEFAELFRELVRLGAVTEEGPVALGVLISCARNYAYLQDLPLPAFQKRRLFFGLLNARITLAAVRASLEMAGLRYPEDRHRLQWRNAIEGSPNTQLPLGGRGDEVIEWAAEIERSLADAIDGFGEPTVEGLVAHDTLYALAALGPDRLLLDGAPICDRVVVMFDDVHRLSMDQRREFLTSIYELRPGVSVWLAERLEALTPSELLSPGATEGREYAEPVVLEQFWRGRRSKSLENFLSNIADRRTRAAEGVHIGSFQLCVGGEVETADGLDDHFRQALKKVRDRVVSTWGESPRYVEWIGEATKQSLDPRGEAVEWRTLEILIERDVRKNQLAFDSIAPLPVDEKNTAGGERAAAEFFLSQEFDIPYYYGLSQLAGASSSNVEQFLDFAAEIFEESAAADMLGRPPRLPANRQEQLLRKAAKRRWDSIPRFVPNGRDVQRLLGTIGRLARDETMRPNAPYAPGVTGIAIPTSERERLAENSAGPSRNLHRLRHALASCLSHNLLDADMNRSQGRKGQTWTVLYLNRWLCIHFGLPLGYGGWRPKRLADLDAWLASEGNLELKMEAGPDGF